MFIRKLVRALSAKLRSLKSSALLGSIGLLVGGTALAQACGVLVLPLITRLYTPDDFTTLAVFASTLSIVSVAACLRLEIALPIPEDDHEAANLLALALCACTLVAVITGTITWIFPVEFTELIGQPALRNYLWLLPIGIWMAGAYAALQFWATRKRRFATIAKTRMTQALGGACTQVLLGWAAFAPFGLLLGQVVSSGAGLFGLARHALRADRLVFRSVTLSGMQRVLKKYDRFPKYSTVEAVSNNAGIQLPIIMIAALSIGPEAGYLMLSMRAMALPMGLIGGAVSQVYLSRAPQEMRAKQLDKFTLQIIEGLAKSGIGPLLFVGIVSPLVFPLVFGKSWQRAGDFVAWMTPWFVMQFLSSPISMVLHVTGNQRAALNLQIFGLVLRASAVGISSALIPSRIVEAYSISGFVFYALYFCVVVRISGIDLRKAIPAVFSSSSMIALWVALATLFAIALKKFTNL